MANESYIERLQNQKKRLIAFIKADIAWQEAMEFAGRTGRKGDAYRVADEKRAAKRVAFAIIEPLLAEKEVANA